MKAFILMLLVVVGFSGILSLGQYLYQHNGHVTGQTTQQCTNHEKCSIQQTRLAQRMCALKDKTMAGEIKWERTNGVIEPVFSFGPSDARFILMSKGAILVLGYIINEETFDINNDCAKDLYKYLILATKYQAQQKREKVLDDFLKSKDR